MARPKPPWTDSRRSRKGPAGSPPLTLPERQERRVAPDSGRVDRDGLFRGESRKVVRSAGFRAGAGKSAAAEGLHADDRADHVAVHIDVADARARSDAARNAVDARVHAERQAVATRIDLVHDFVDPGSAEAHDVKDRAKHLALEAGDA